MNSTTALKLQPKLCSFSTNVGEQNSAVYSITKFLAEVLELSTIWLVKKRFQKMLLLEFEIGTGTNK